MRKSINSIFIFKYLSLSLSGLLVMALLLSIALPATVDAEETSTPKPVTIEMGNSIDNTGMFVTNVTVCYPDNLTSVAIEKGNSVLPSTGPLTYISIMLVNEPSHVPSDFNICGLAYDIQPRTVSFKEDVVVTLDYNADLVPLYSTPFMAWFNTMTGGWTRLDTFYLDKVNHTVSVKVKGFSIFGVFNQKTTSSATTTDTSSPKASTSPTITETLFTSIPPTTKEPQASTISWTIIGGIVVAVLVVALMIYAFAPRRR